jgi:acyl-CoA thioesterase-1
MPNHSEGLRPSDSQTRFRLRATRSGETSPKPWRRRALVGPHYPHSARVGSLARSFAKLSDSVLKSVLALIIALCSLVSGCSPSSDRQPAATEQPASQTPPEARAPSPVAERPKIAVLGDSLTAGLGLTDTQSFPSLLQKKLEAAGLPYQVINAGVSGDTSAGGLRRLDWVLQENVRVLVVALGANDGLRGLPVAEMKRNLAQIIETAKGRHVLVVLAGMEAPPNYGVEYIAAFRQAYRDLAQQYDLPFVPFLLEGVAGVPALNQGDGIHPNPAGAQIVADTVWSVLQPVVSQLSAS